MYHIQFIKRELHTLIESLFKVMSKYICSEMNLIFTQENGRAKTLYSIFETHQKSYQTFLSYAKSFYRKRFQVSATLLFFISVLGQILEIYGSISNQY